MVVRSDIEKLMLVLTILGAIIAIFEAVIGLTSISFPNFNVNLIGNIVAIVIAILCLISALKPGDPIPFNWIILLIFSIVLIILGTIIGGILILIAGILGLLIEADVF
jgi:hypothetical protein